MTQILADIFVFALMLSQTVKQTQNVNNKHDAHHEPSHQPTEIISLQHLLRRDVEERWKNQGLLRCDVSSEGRQRRPAHCSCASRCRRASTSGRSCSHSATCPQQADSHSLSSSAGTSRPWTSLDTQVCIVPVCVHVCVCYRDIFMAAVLPNK